MALRTSAPEHGAVMPNPLYICGSCPDMPKESGNNLFSSARQTRGSHAFRTSDTDYGFSRNNRGIGLGIPGTVINFPPSTNFFTRSLFSGLTRNNLRGSPFARRVRNICIRCLFQSAQDLFHIIDQQNARLSVVKYHSRSQCICGVM